MEPAWRPGKCSRSVTFRMAPLHLPGASGATDRVPDLPESFASTPIKSRSILFMWQQYIVTGNRMKSGMKLVRKTIG